MSKTTKQISVTIEINASAAVVFDTVTDWEKQSNWVFLTKVRGVGNNSRELGGKLEAFTGIGTIGFLDTMTITSWDQPRLCEVTHTGNIVKGVGIFEVSVKNSFTYFTWTERVEIPFGFVGKLGWIVAKPFIYLPLFLSVKRLKRYIERGRG